MQTIYIFGHRNPDTDSICSSIALSYLKNALGGKTIARAIGHLNNETKFVLKYFNVPEPQYLNDVRVRIKNIKYDKKACVNEKDSIFSVYEKMQEQHITAVPIINEHRKLIGFITMKDLAKFLVMGNKEIINTNLNNVINTIHAEIITKFDENIIGNIMTVGFQSSTFHDEIKLTSNDILIVGDRYKIINYAIDSNVKMIILAMNSNIDNKLIKKAERNKITILRTEMSSFQIANRIALSNYIESINTTPNPITVFDDDYYIDFQSMIKRINHTNFPVINHKNECLGLISLSWSNEYNKQKVILVDHNSFSQSIEGIEEADILEIIDHHNLGNIGTTMPINFRSMPVGCTATMIYNMYLENKISIPLNIAGCLVSAILSDTLLLTSPTTTLDDQYAAISLAKIAKIDIKKYGMEMFKAASSIKGLTVNQQVYQDYKSYTVGDKQMGIGILMTLDIDEIKDNIDEYILKLEEISSNNHGITALFITDILKNGSYVIYNRESERIIQESFNLNEIHEGIFIKGLVSRKKQMLPAIMEILEK